MAWKTADRIVLDAILRRIARQGDCQIAMSRHALETLYRVLGFDWQVQEAIREIDAMALEALTKTAIRALHPAPQQGASGD
jgi:VIT1/CCC1 family predicted Fe2+/Mn2+ transporter